MKKSIQTLSFLDSVIRLVYKPLLKEKKMEKVKATNIQIAIVIIGILIITSSTYGGWVMV